MARIGQYKALGTGLGGYKSTLSKVQSMEYAKKHADWKAQEQKSLYNEIGGTVSNILGIVKEKHLLDEQKARQQKYDDKYLPLDKPGRPQVPGPEPYQEEMIGDVGTDPEAGLGRLQDFDTSAPIPGLESSWDVGMKGEQDIGEAPAEIDYSGAATAGQGATQYRKITPKPSGALPMTGVPFAESGGIKQEDFSAEESLMKQWEQEDASNPLFNQEVLTRLEAADEIDAQQDRRTQARQRVGVRESNEDLRLRAQRLGMTEEQVLQREAESRPQGEQVYIKSGKTYYADESGQRSPSRLDDTPLEGYRPGSGGREPYVPPVFGDAKSAALDAYDRTPLAKPERPNIPANVDFINDMTESPVMGKVDMASPEMLGDEAVMDMISDPTLGDFDKGALPSQSALERQLVSKMKERGLNIGTKDIDQLVNEFASVESKGQNIRQELSGEVGTGKGTGKGAGFFQFETGVDEQGKKLGYGTGIQRVKNMYKDVLGKKVPSWVNEAAKHGDPRKLSKEQQRELLIANLYMQEQSENLSGGNTFGIMGTAFKNKDFSELWAKKHWAGAKADTSEYQAKIKQYQRDKGRYKF